MASPFPLSKRFADARPGCKTQKIAPTLRQEGSRSRLGVLSPKKKLEHFKTSIVGLVKCCLQCGLPVMFAHFVEEVLSKTFLLATRAPHVSIVFDKVRVHNYYLNLHALNS
ncbi:hypothetical protein PoB_002275600 [Plakobranchus ocellatus]|uniref:Uncharacterized protein n=1 Tax=Plakobranchus ocellatus TaxID=259542 RepID=A0AAV3ZP06_9GAST|nr:hypothetical protein PoB_002275600 [Plakobranchus ocellatus]